MILSLFPNFSEPQFPHLYHILKLDIRVKNDHGRIWEYLEITVGYAHLLQNITKQNKTKNKIKQLSFIERLCGGEGNGTPLQYSCLENPRDGGAW